MDVTRRHALRIASLPVVSTCLAGCLSGSEPGNDDGEPRNGTDDRTGRDDNDEGSDGRDGVDETSIDGRLHNEADTAATFTVAIRNQDDDVVVDDEWVVDADSTTVLPAFGTPGQPRTFEVTVNGATATETLAFDVEPTPGKRDGYVDITCTADGRVEIAFTPIKRDGDDGFQRVDTPPYEITEPECDPSDGDRDPLWLCENMAAEPTRLLDQVETTGSVLRSEGLQRDHDGRDPQFYATLLTDAADLDRVETNRNSSAVKLIEETDFDSEAVLIAQTGWGSGSVTPHLERIEATENGFRAFGCYRRPCVWTDDYTKRTVMARFERPDDLSAGVVSLTVDAETRVNVRVDEGVVTVE